MSISTFSQFFYDFKVDSTSNKLNFEETAGGGELTATVDSGTYTLTEILIKIKTAMDAVSVNALVYTLSVDRSSRIVTIAGTGAFSLLVSTGAQSGVSVFGTIGFTGADRVSATSHDGDTEAGDIFKPQFILQSFIDKDDFQEKIDATINESADGEIEVVSFGTRKFTEFNIRFITNLPGDGKVIKNNPTGRADFQRFMQNITTRAPFEFMADIGVATFLKVQLETTESSRDGTGYLTKEMLSDNLPGYFQSGKLKLRVFE